MCVYVGDEVVVDVYGTSEWAKNKSKESLEPDHLQCIMSSGKSVASILMAIMVDQGKLEYDDPISKHWPEFG